MKRMKIIEILVFFYENKQWKPSDLRSIILTYRATSYQICSHWYNTVAPCRPIIRVAEIMVLHCENVFNLK